MLDLSAPFGHYTPTPIRGDGDTTMVPFKRKVAEFTGEQTSDGRPIDNYTGEQVTIVGAAPGDDDEYKIRVNGREFRVFGEDLHPHPDAPATNSEFIAHLFDWGRHGAMLQAFVLEGAAKYAEQIAKNPDATRKAMADSMIHPDAWIATAVEVRDAINDHLKGRAS